ncbi:type II toxin-antitoxin system VapC family toxin [Sphaerospermopsis sp. LEGE 08334]|jgi:predicted nucleic acid-binding protein|uniref:type II toxin-antitoxin system VapC family toxin n=1 Tax=Sphaerospermopsis sp. LEGE 08334 TaxID=1828651 RepID=UPI001882B044|nr:type II toxin-antitoxin system VapC family toxin [Sphaerospermopsis sp. LEGE 08334]MBE9056745.1 type II toxin-antitoxin system VapC family toxin [Sphaerospermopsis sp. LEGE 08334]
MTYLLDTCVISEYVKKQPCERVINWIDVQEESSLFISIITIAEIKKGVVRIEKSQPSRYQKLEKWLQKLEQRFANRILPLNENILDTWAKICGKSEAEGKKLPIMDSLIAATASENNLIIVTRNISDFGFSSVNVFSPWD